MNLPRLFELEILKLVSHNINFYYNKNLSKTLYGTITVGLGFASSRQTPSLSKRSITLQVKRTLWPLAVHLISSKFLGPFLRFWTQKLDRKSTRLNSSHVRISYAVF